MKGVVRKWKNGAAVRIPASGMADVHSSLGQAVDVQAEGRRIVVKPIRAEGFDIGDLVAGITNDNRHEVVEFGDPVGCEVW